LSLDQIYTLQFTGYMLIFPISINTVLGSDVHLFAIYS